MGELFALTEEEKTFLLHLAREVIATRCEKKSPPRYPFFSEKLKRKLGVFVSLHSGNDLRGCIGYVKGIKPLQDAVADMADSAAFGDSRFFPVTRQELPNIFVEISVLSELKKVHDTNNIEIGKDGLLIEKGFFSGLLLPQVAREQGWDRKTFLSQTCLKAGLPKDEWQSGNCTIYTFTADIFSEHEFS